MNIAGIPLTLGDYLRFHVQKPQVGAESESFLAKRPARATVIMALIRFVPKDKWTDDGLRDLRARLTRGLTTEKPEEWPSPPGDSPRAAVRQPPIVNR